ncbi:MAG: protein tyrosine phosphatase [Bacteroidetes bacterium]|nr:protein tyrosine phosphatase [Bacteroidota bacterium]
MKILILCTGNSCRSQMAHGFMKTIDSSLIVRSAGTKPEKQVNKYAVQVMSEIGIDISNHTPHFVDEYIAEPWDYVITVCDHAKEVCPVFTGNVKNRLHLGFEDPADATGTDEEKLIVYRKIRDQIKQGFIKDFYPIIQVK